MFDTEAIAHSFGRAAERYDQHAHLQRQVRRACLDASLPLWPDNASVLDVGCGTGALCNEIAEAGRRDVSLLGLDISWGMCRQSAAQNLSVVQASSDSIPFSSGVFDGVFSSLMLQWADKPAMVFSEIARLLRPGGIAVIATLTDGTLKELRESFSLLDDTPHLSEFYQPHDVLCCAEETGLTLKTAQQQTITEYYQDTVALMRSLKVIGASNKHAGRSRGMMTPKKLARLEQHYSNQYAGKQGLPASWQVLLLVLQKG